MNVIDDLYYVTMRALLAFAVAFAVTAGIGCGARAAFGRRTRDAKQEVNTGAAALAFPPLALEEAEYE